MRKLAIVILVSCCFFGCKKTTSQATIDDEIIKQYIFDNRLTAIAEPNGLYYAPTTVGTGAYPTDSSVVTVNYKGYLTNDTVFDNSEGPVPLALPGAIAGLQQGIPLMQAGGSAILLIPSALGYGSQSYNHIPANAVLIYNVQMLSIH